jgi:hypothetical protein
VLCVFFRVPESLDFFDTWRVMHRVGMLKRLRPQLLTPFFCKLLRQLLTRKPEPVGASLPIDQLQVAEFVKEYVIKHESTNGEPRPFSPCDSTKLLGLLAQPKRSRQAHTRGKSTESNFAPATIDVTEHPGTSTAVIEMDRAKPGPQLQGQSAKDNADVLRADMMDANSGGGGDSEFDAIKHLQNPRRFNQAQRPRRLVRAAYNTNGSPASHDSKRRSSDGATNRSATRPAANSSEPRSSQTTGPAVSRQSTNSKTVHPQ